MAAPPLAVAQPDGTRQYVHPLTGEIVPSITTVLKCVSKPALDGWSARVTAAYASEHWDELDAMDPVQRLELLKGVHEETRQKPADRGTLVHEICDSWAKGAAPVKIDKSVDGFITQFFGFLSEMNPEYIESEGTVWNHRHEYAGTFDAIAMINGEVTLIDIKTGRGVYPEYGMQLAALSHGECMVDEHGGEWEMPKVQKHALLHLRPRSWKLVPVRETEACYSAFLAARLVFHWVHEIAPDVLGDPYGN
jgi:hypothetical protein